MISLDCHHPDLEEFIDVKTDLNRVTKANISVRVTDDFMEAVKSGENFDLTFLREPTGEMIKKTVNAADVFYKLAKNNWNYAEPGCLFWDRIENWNLLSNDPTFQYQGVNPCAEEPLPGGGSCLLGSINLAAYVVDAFTENASFDLASFRQDVCIAVRALNEVLDEGLPLHPLQEQRDSVRDWRQIGLGIMGLADMLIKMNCTYGTTTSTEFCDRIGYELAQAAIASSMQLAVEEGSYPKYNAEAIAASHFLKSHDVQLSGMGLRNSQLLTIAPTGSISTMIGVSGGIEPIFANSYTRKTESLHGEDVYYKVYTPIVEEYMKKFNITDEADLPEFFVTAADIDYLDRIEMQGVWQDHIDASISSTVNLPEDTTIDEVYDLYVRAWERGLKGITIFRDGCKRTAILTTKEEAKEETNELKRGEVIPASDNLIGLKRKLMTGCGSLHCTAFFDMSSGDLLEVYLSKGSTGGCNNFMVGLSRMISTAARGGISINDIVDQLMSTGSCPSYATRAATKKDTSRGSCCPMAVGYALKEMYEDFQNMVIGKQNKSKETAEKASSPLCPTCGEPLHFEGGCNICRNCGYTKCD